MKNTSPSTSDNNKTKVKEVSASKARKDLSSIEYALIWAKTAGRCHFCNKILYEHHLTKEDCNLGELAHIVAYSVNGPRGDKVLSGKLDGKEVNFLLLCHDCHKYIDNEGCLHYSREVLNNLKRDREEEIRRITEMTVNCKSNVLKYTAKIGDVMPVINADDCHRAMMDRRYFPADKDPINLCGTDYGTSDYDENFFETEANRLRVLFNRHVLNGNEHERAVKHYSIFALAPQPLLVLLGTLISGLTHSEVYQFHRDPVQSWTWPEIDFHDNATIIEPEISASENPAIILAFSADAIIGNVKHQYPELQHWIVKANNPSYHWCNSKDQQNEFKAKVGIVLNKIKEKCPGQDIHLFLAVPASLAVEFGRVWMSKADAPLLIYDINQKTKQYIKVLKIEN